MEIELSRIVRAVRRFWWIVPVVAVIFGGLAGVLGTVPTESYTSESSLIIVSTDELLGNSSTIVELATADTTLQPILNEFGIESTVEEFRNSNLEVYGVGGTSIVRIEVTHSDPQVAADLSNAIASSTISRSSDLGLGVIQRDLDNLVFERDQIINQLATINVQIDQLNESSGDLSSEDQVRLDQLKSDRLSLEQRRSDMESRIRSARNSVSTFIAPVVINDEAAPSGEGDGTSVAILVVVGIFLGGIVGAAIMLFLELRDPFVRDRDHLRDLLGFDSITQINRDSFDDNNTAASRILATRAAGVARQAGSTTVTLVSLRSDPESEAAAEYVQSSLQSADLNVASALGLLDEGADVNHISPETTVVLLAEKGKTRNEDVQEVADILRDLNVAAASVALIE